MIRKIFSMFFTARLMLIFCALLQLAFGGICNAAVQHIRICNPAITNCGMLRAALQMPLNRVEGLPLPDIRFTILNPKHNEDLSGFQNINKDLSGFKNLIGQFPQPEIQNPKPETILLQVGAHSFSTDDFEYVYHKNNQTLDECLALYIPYKLKIAAAKDAGLDTLSWIVNEWTRYRDQMATKYLMDAAIENYLLDGLLVFAITDSAVWSKAARDSIGLKAFYKKRARTYKWKKRMDATIYYCSSEKIAERLNRAVKNKNESLVPLPNGLFTFFCEANDVSPCVDTVRRTLPKGANTVADRVKWEKGCTKILKWNNKFVFLDVHSILPPVRKTFEEARGETIAGYQDELERRWMEQLKKKYPVTIDQEVWTNLKKKYAE